MTVITHLMARLSMKTFFSRVFKSFQPKSPRKRKLPDTWTQATHAVQAATLAVTKATRSVNTARAAEAKAVKALKKARKVQKAAKAPTPTRAQMRAAMQIPAVNATRYVPSPNAVCAKCGDVMVQ
jgi:hypothetical protein